MTNAPLQTGRRFARWSAPPILVVLLAACSGGEAEPEVSTAAPSAASDTVPSDNNPPDNNPPDTIPPDVTDTPAATATTAPAPTTAAETFDVVLNLVTSPTGEHIDLVDPGDGRMCIRVFADDATPIEQRYCTTVQRSEDPNAVTLVDSTLGLYAIVYDVPTATTSVVVTAGAHTGDGPLPTPADGIPVGSVDLVEFAATKKFGALFVPADVWIETNGQLCSHYENDEPQASAPTVVCIVVD